MLSLDGIRTLFLVLELGSFSRAAGVLGVPTSTVSRRVRELEASLGREVVARSGRGARAVRDAGELLGRLRDVLDAVDAVQAVGGGEDERPLTTLRLTVPMEMSLRIVPDVIAQLRERYPQLVWEVRGENRRAAIVDEDLDVAVRVGALSDSSLLAADLGRLEPWLVRPPGFPRVEGPDDLVGTPTVSVRGTPEVLQATWRGSPVALRLPVAARVSSFATAVALVARGIGQAVVPAYSAREAALGGQVVPVGDLVLPGVPVHALYPRRHRRQPVVRDLVAALRAGGWVG